MGKSLSITIAGRRGEKNREKKAKRRKKERPPLSLKKRGRGGESTGPTIVAEAERVWVSITFDRARKSRGEVFHHFFRHWEERGKEARHSIPPPDQKGEGKRRFIYNFSPARSRGSLPLLSQNWSRKEKEKGRKILSLLSPRKNMRQRLEKREKKIHSVDERRGGGYVRTGKKRQSKAGGKEKVLFEKGGDHVKKGKRGSHTLARRGRKTERWMLRRGKRPRMAAKRKGKKVSVREKGGEV